jgi:hypothetical protein
MMTDRPWARTCRRSARSGDDEQATESPALPLDWKRYLRPGYNGAIRLPVLDIAPHALAPRPRQAQGEARMEAGTMTARILHTRSGLALVLADAMALLDTPRPAPDIAQLVPQRRTVRRSPEKSALKEDRRARKLARRRKP